LIIDLWPDILQKNRDIYHESTSEEVSMGARMMKRREFLSACAGFLAGALVGRTSVFSATVRPEADLLQGITIIDAHSHPDEFWSTRSVTDFSASFTSIKKLGMSACVFCAVGDSKDPRVGFWEESFPGVMVQLDKAMRYVQTGQTKLVLKASDIPNPLRPGDPVGAILGIEGANPLQDDLARFDEVYRFGVRLITLGHYKVSGLTDVMTEPPKHGGLSALGRKAIEKMDKLGIVIDVAHASADALKQIAEVTRRPLIDSHTNPCPGDTRPCGRFRSWREMELIAKTDGVVCTWPIAWRKGDYRRETFLDWAKEISAMKQRIGIEHVGLGTDSGGHLPDRVAGFKDVADLGKLVAAMLEAGLTREDVAAYMGGNFLRVFRAYSD
jgi:membrane dipeptidase